MRINAGDVGRWLASKLNGERGSSIVWDLTGLGFPADAEMGAAPDATLVWMLRSGSPPREEDEPTRGNSFLA